MKNIYLILISIFLFSSCQKYVDLDLKELTPTIVVDAFVTDKPSESYIRLTMSKGLKGNLSTNYPNITDARVRLTDNRGNTINFTTDSEGIYRTTQKLIPNNSYTLDVHKGDYHCTANQSMLQPVILTDFTNENSSINLYFSDNPDEKDYYWVKGYRLSGGGYYRVFSILINDFEYDKKNHKLSIEDEYEYFSSLNTSSSYKIEIFHINKETYDYLNTLDNIQDLSYGITPFSTGAVGNPNTNLSNGIGYFAVASMSSLQKNIAN